ncbi:hypothetical protein [Methyloferula stellata]|uniref:hypothetical protein n=1 Tax=Methyloferula stellata TaxID=876270 RepID=UPI000382D1D3|nr:hypothetical protein [Methyloferula stellata]
MILDEPKIIVTDSNSLKRDFSEKLVSTFSHPAFANPADKKGEKAKRRRTHIRRRS